MTGRRVTKLTPEITEPEPARPTQAGADALRLAELSLDAATEPLYRVARDGCIA